MFLSRVLSVCLLGALALSTTGCGGVDKKACGRLESTLNGIRRQAMTQVDDPLRVAQTYSSGATTLRDQAKGTDGSLRRSAEKAAGALDQLGRQVKAAADGTGSSVDSSALIAATNELKHTCGS
ncbi:hypothetical protein [Actinoallomurus rhizosphaericola]|uniref:hypothetical protein n=1 Tax=Actinoallomurus rhizosphaericola TaxID=2952536 RepID=UPI002092BE7A|nr:hypothetical protein [Actinoallomurus rhizosphaericola]MCO5999838.1 hypothetical protein [Actinoallomurus rhizosphaericola]